MITVFDKIAVAYIVMLDIVGACTQAIVGPYASVFQDVNVAT